MKAIKNMNVWSKFYMQKIRNGSESFKSNRCYCHPQQEIWDIV